MKPLHRSFLHIILFTVFSISIARDTITPTLPLPDDETLVSSAGNFELGFFTPNNSNNRYVGIWYNKIATRTIVWVANRANPVTNSTGILSITSEGVLTITDKNSKLVWSVTTTGLTNPVAQLLESGNFVVTENNTTTENYAWQGFDYPTDTQLPGMKIGVDKRTGLNRILQSWKSDSDPSPGAYSISIDTRGDPELYLYSGSQKIWRSGTWDGDKLSGTPDFSSNHGYNFGYLNNSEDEAYIYYVSDSSTVARLLVNQSGEFQATQWLTGSSQWSFFWHVPDDSCDYFGRCGPYGICDSNRSQICECLVQPEFMPKSPADWSEGCIRKTGLDCKGSTDRFIAVSNVKLPQSADSMVNISTSSPDVCSETCLENCSCTAYAISGSSGCIIWFSDLVDLRYYAGADDSLYVRVAADTGQKHINTKKLAIILSLLSGTLLLSCLGCFLCKREKKRSITLGAANSFTNNTTSEGGGGNFLDPPLFDFGNDVDFSVFGFGTIASATDYFSSENKLGEGGFGPVYKGKLGEDQEIAVKRLATSSQQGTEEFKNEVMLIAKLQNVNLVRLLGCCFQGEERMLIYEYMPNRSLDTFLFDKEKAAFLDWETRYKIIIGISRGLLYLHHDSRYRIIHRDLKASNILLDEEMNPKISDFGMARLFGGKETNYNTRKVVGTYGYMSPEYAMHGIFSLKSDVFSFGVLLLEIISGKRNRGTNAVTPHLNLIAHAWSLWNEGESLKLVEESLSETFPMNDLLKCIQVGLLCVQDHPEDRPLMSSVIVMLGADIASLPQPKQPGFIAEMNFSDLDQILNMQHSFMSNDLTVSVVGR